MGEQLEHRAGRRVGLIAGGGGLHLWLLRALTAPPSLLGPGYVFASLAPLDAARPDLAADFDLVIVALSPGEGPASLAGLRATAPTLPLLAVSLTDPAPDLASALAALAVPLVAPLAEVPLREAAGSLLK